MFLSRTRKKLIHSMKESIFRIGDFQSMLDENEKFELEKSMGFPGQWEEHRRFQIQFLQHNGLRPNHKFLEIGCGPLTAGIPIISYLEQNKYTGIDIRTSVLNMSWSQIGKANLSAKNPRLIHSTDFGDTILDGELFDTIHSFSVLYHLSDDLLHACFRSVAQRLKSNGVYFANVNTEYPSDRWLEFPFIRRTIAEYASTAKDANLQIKDLGTLADLGFRLHSAEKLNRMLRIEHI